MQKVRMEELLTNKQVQQESLDQIVSKDKNNSTEINSRYNE